MDRDYANYGTGNSCCMRKVALCVTEIVRVCG
jgi:hypothetical protein